MYIKYKLKNNYIFKQLGTVESRLYTIAIVYNIVLFHEIFYMYAKYKLIYVKEL